MHPGEPKADAQARRGQLAKLVREGRFRQALALCGELRRAFPDDGSLAAMEGFSSLRLGLHDRAAAAAAEAVRLGHDELLSLFTLGAANQKLGRHAEALAALTVANRRSPRHSEIASLLLEAAAAARGMDHARALFPVLAAAAPDPAVRTAWARLLFREGLDAELPPGVISAPLTPVREWVAGGGGTVDWSGPAEPVVVEDPVAFGEAPPEAGRRVHDSYPPYVCTLKGATVFSKSNMILAPDGAVLNDTAADPQFGRYIDFASDALVAERRRDRLLLLTGHYAPMPPVEAGVMLSGSASEHFGHWIPEYLVKLRFLARHPRFAELPIIVDEQMPAQHFEYLARLAPNPVLRLEAGRSLRCEALIVAAPATFFPVHLTPDHQVPPDRQGGGVPASFGFLRDRVLATMPASGPASGAVSGRRRIYLSRARRGGRRPLNEAEIAGALEAAGFETVFPEDLDFARQVALFRQAEVVVAANGSSLLNAIFAPTDARLIVLSQRGLFNWGTFHGLMRELGHDLLFVCDDGETPHKHANYRIPVARLLAAVGG